MMTKPTVTFVTALIDLNENIVQSRTPEIRLTYFKHLAESGIAICIYLSKKYETLGRELETQYKNVKIMPLIDIEELETYKLIKSYNTELPLNRTECHDTMNFLILMNSKTEFVYKATIENPFNTEHFAWIDFSIFHIITDIDKIKSNLYLFGYSQLKEKFLIAPGCWTLEHSHQIINNDINNIITNVNWRFCGGFFMGDKASIQDMHLLMNKEIPNFIKHTGKNSIAWEVNVWAWVEDKYNWKIDWYIADHNDTILYIPTNYISVVASLNNSHHKINELETYINNGQIIKNETNENSLYKSNLFQTKQKSILHKYIDKVIYINLEFHQHKREEIETELNKFNIEYERFNAVQIPNDGIGCTQSHLEVIKMAKEKGYKNILIFEDDFIFTVSKEVFEEQIELLFNSKNHSGEPFTFDVCLLSYNLFKSEKCNEYPFLKKVLDVQTTAGYIINESMYDLFIDLYSWTLPFLKNTRKHWIYILDQIWKILQPIKKWYCFDIRIGKQRPFYIDNGNGNGKELFIPDY